MDKKKEIGYLDSFAADLSIIAVVIDSLYLNLNKANYPQEDIDEIVLAMDESVTNAVQETIKKYTDVEDNKNRRDITIRYLITENEFEATIIDHGNGLDLFNILNIVPDKDSQKYIEQINNYATESEKQKLIIRINGQPIPLRGIGAGLKIILKFMDLVSIDLIDKNTILSRSVTSSTDGTIFNLRRKKRY